MKSIVILTGAGISQESGIRTFRDSDGLWENHRVEDVASPEGFERNPPLVHEFYNQRRWQLQLGEIRPNPAHEALAELERNWKGDFLLVTQNVDNLHERAGSRRLLHMHGELLKVRCRESGEIFEWLGDLTVAHRCPCCDTPGTLRPHIVWFGEIPLFMDEITERLRDAELFVSVGTSGQIYPAAGFVQLTPSTCRRIEVNAALTAISRTFYEHLVGPASLKVSELVKTLLDPNSGTGTP